MEHLLYEDICYTQKLMDVIIEKASKMKEKAIKIKEQCENMKQIDYLTDNEIKNLFIENNNDGYLLLKRDIYNVYEALELIYTRFHFNKIHKSTKKIEKQKDYSNEIEVKYSDGIIAIKMPRVPKRVFFTLNSMFADEIYTKLDTLNKITPIQKMEYKEIYFINVFPSNYRRDWVPDNDNYDIKRILDRMSWFIGGDGGASTFIKIETYIGDEIKPGTYIIIRPTEEPKIEKITKFFG